jgi:20S proteasome subunit alpha 2
MLSYSPSGKLVQIEYALHAVAAGNTSIGIKGLSLTNVSTSNCFFIAKDGVVIASEKKISSILIDEASLHKV